MGVDPVTGKPPDDEYAFLKPGQVDTATVNPSYGYEWGDDGDYYIRVSCYAAVGRSSMMMYT